MSKLIKISGKANRVFKYVEILSHYKGNVTLKELEKGNKTLKLDLRA
jgi:hypothetical protein